MADTTTKKPGFFAKVKQAFQGVGKFFRETRSELKKVVWPSKSQIINNSVVVLVVVLVASLFILLLDVLFGGILRVVLDAAAGL